MSKSDEWFPQVKWKKHVKTEEELETPVCVFHGSRFCTNKKGHTHLYKQLVCIDTLKQYHKGEIRLNQQEILEQVVNTLNEQSETVNQHTEQIHSLYEKINEKEAILETLEQAVSKLETVTEELRQLIGELENEVN